MFCKPVLRQVLLFLTCCCVIASAQNRSFRIDFENDRFLMDGVPFRYISGSVHYFRVPHQLWSDRLMKLKFAGFNAVETVVEWASHEPEQGQYDFTGQQDLFKYLETAQQQGLYVILRPGPYICAERDFGGFPYWLLKDGPTAGIRLRSSESTYLNQVDRWLSVLLPRLTPYLYRYGGPIIMVQVENEYGSYSTCDFRYTAHLRDVFQQYLGRDTVLFTTDGPGDGYLKCGKIDEVYATVDFGPGQSASSCFAAQRAHQARGPLINSEFYPGWLDHWAQPHETVDTSSIITSLQDILNHNASVNMYMFHGGTNWGFLNGANMGATYEPDPTSYDYDAPLDEAGDPTEKYFAIAELIHRNLGTESQVHKALTCNKMALPVPVTLSYISSVFDVLKNVVPTVSKYPLTMEQLGQAYGYLMYETTIGTQPSDPAILNLPGLADRGLVFVNQVFQGIASRMFNAYTVPIRTKQGDLLQIFVENQGRIGYGSQMTDYKGLTKNVTLGPILLSGWSHYKVPTSVDLTLVGTTPQPSTSMSIRSMRAGDSAQLPGYFAGAFSLPHAAQDTFLKLGTGWGKGHVILNGNVLGRYWPATGPQVTLYAPAPFFVAAGAVNRLEIFEMESSPCSLPASADLCSTESSAGSYLEWGYTVMGPECQVTFVDTPVINGSVPYGGALGKKKPHLFAHND